jgi:hypothetical protein
MAGLEEIGRHGITHVPNANKSEFHDSSLMKRKTGKKRRLSSPLTFRIARKF